MEVRRCGTDVAGGRKHEEDDALLLLIAWLVRRHFVAACAGKLSAADAGSTHVRCPGSNGRDSGQDSGHAIANSLQKWLVTGWEQVGDAENCRTS